MGQVVYITPEESPRMNRDRFEDLYRQFGDPGAEDIICRAVEALSARMAKCQRLYRAGRPEDMRRNLRSQIVISDQIGLVSLAEAARHVQACLDRQDGVALAATLARLLRIGDRSLSAVWDLRDLSL